MAGEAEMVKAVQDTVKWAGELVAKGKPSSSLPSQMANAVPKVDDWQALTGAQGPNILKLAWNVPGVFYGKNVDIVLNLNWDYGARYKGGGAFITNCWVTVPTCEVEWGFDVDIHFSAQAPENRQQDDSKPTLAGLPVSVIATISNTLVNHNHTWSFLLLGDGNWHQT
jgi:hypothetical protein